MGQLGCWADGINAQCRFCGSGVYRNVTCPNDRALATLDGADGAVEQHPRLLLRTNGDRKRPVGERVAEEVFRWSTQGYHTDSPGLLSGTMYARAGMTMLPCIFVLITLVFDWHAT